MTKTELIEIGNRLRTRRTELKVTRERMAELANITTGYYGQLEVGSSQMSLDTLAKLSESMHISMEYIVNGDEREPADPSAIIELLKNCSGSELKIAEEVLKLFIMKSTARNI